jgi:hypothetical protein
MTRLFLFPSLFLMTTSVAALRAVNTNSNSNTNSNHQEVAIIPSEAEIGEVLLSSARFLENKNSNQYT